MRVDTKPVMTQFTEVLEEMGNNPDNYTEHLD